MASPINPTGVIDNPELASLQAKFLENIINPVLTLALLACFVIFISGGIRFLVMKEMNPEESKKGKTHLLAGGVAMFIVASIWGIIGFLGSVTDSSLWFVK